MDFKPLETMNTGDYIQHKQNLHHGKFNSLEIHYLIVDKEYFLHELVILRPIPPKGKSVTAWFTLFSEGYALKNFIKTH